MLLNAYIRQLLTKIREALKNRPEEGGKVIHVVSKIMARAVQIVNYIKITIEDDPLTGVYFIVIPRCLLRECDLVASLVLAAFRLGTSPPKDTSPLPTFTILWDAPWC